MKWNPRRALNHRPKTVAVNGYWTQIRYAIPALNRQRSQQHNTLLIMVITVKIPPDHEM